jgi:chemotaxis protein MotB
MAKKGDSRGGDKPTVIIRKEEVVEGGHHGGAWKVAYADFVTAMMAFFLLMWLLNATTEAQRRGLADYFSPSNVLSATSSGTGKPFGGRTPYEQGQMASDNGATEVIPGKAAPQPNVGEDDTETSTATTQQNGSQADADASGDESSAPTRAPSDADVAAARAAAEKKSFESAASEIKQAIAADPALHDLGQQLAVDMTRDGLRIQIMDADKVEMFATGSADLNDRAKQLLQKIAPVLQKLTEPISVAGYTDARPFALGERTNWELSADRANATRRFLEQSGLPGDRIESVTGNADRDLLLPDQPFAAANRRIAIVVLRESGKATTPKLLAAPAPAPTPTPVPAAPVSGEN